MDQEKHPNRNENKTHEDDSFKDISKRRRTENSQQDSMGHHFGNFHSYYGFHNPSTRYSAIFQGTFERIWNNLGQPKTFSILDIGCNEGDLTVELLAMAKLELPHVECVALGIDLDETLIIRAREKYKAIQNINFAQIDCMAPNSIKSIGNILSRDAYSLVSAFSITMWIHMNHGDIGLLNFLRLLSSLSLCSVLVEPQKWISYRKAMQRCRRLGLPELPYYQNLKIRSIEEECIRFYKEIGSEMVWRVPCTEWGREIMLFESSHPPVTTTNSTRYYPQLDNR
jgi:SAM-dependent methyltransferase